MYLPTQKDSMPKERMLIIDDDEFNRVILDNLFSDFYTVEEAGNGKIGLDMIAAAPNRYSVVLLDTSMPEMSGIDVLHSLRELGLNGKFPIFLITAEAGDSIAREAYRLDVTDVILKPVVPYAVVKRVNSVVELFRAREQLNSRIEYQNFEILEKERRISRLNRGLFETLAAAVEFRSGESGGHVRRIHDITRFMLANTSLGNGMSGKEIENISLAAVMHDVGKIAIPDAILNKPGRLTKEEFDVIKTHTTLGALLLEKIPQLRETDTYYYAYDIALHHHERWDGGGYPDGLKGDKITLCAQIVSLADVYDALRCKRVYKAALLREKVLDMICGGECGVFNPALLKCFLSAEEELSRMYDGPTE